LVADLGDVIERHLKLIGLIQTEEPDAARQQLIADKRAELKKRAGTTETGGDDTCDFPSDAQLCIKCSTKAVIKLDGCMTCLNCGDSKCG
ncbi:MAG: NrdJb, partial [Gammaproteobacteria bacterium]|nr:NrdJb [Gammaproteobacteria bacterium]